MSQQLSSVVVVATFKAQPGKEQELLATLPQVVRDTHELDEGCLTYEVSRGIDDPTSFVAYEVWASQQALDQHLHSPHFTQWLSSVQSLMIGSIEPMPFLRPIA